MKKEAFLHPTILIACGGLVLWLVWTQVPSTQQLKAPHLKQNAPSVSLPDLDTLAFIRDVTASGEIITDHNPPLWILEDSRFQSLNANQLQKTRKLLVGKKISLPENATNNILRLPIELYDPLCFNSPPTDKISCPIILKP